MNQTTQHISPDPALDFAQGILEETNGAIELIDILREIAEGSDEDATTNDLIAANTVLTDRAFGKCPTLVSPNPGQSPDTAPTAGSDLSTANEKGGACPERSRRVTQIDESLNQSLGPPPKPCPEPAEGAHSQDAGDAAIPSDSPEPFDPYSVHFAIQQYILSVTNNGRTLRDALLKVARTKDDPKDQALPPAKVRHYPGEPRPGNEPQRRPQSRLPIVPTKAVNSRRLPRSH